LEQRHGMGCLQVLVLPEATDGSAGTYPGSPVLHSNTHYLPSRVHPALAMYSTLGKRELKGCTSSFSWAETICRETH
jgi:hypothetical protein